MYNFNKFSVAPMMNRTNRHFRFFLRQFTLYSLLYTEMTTTSSILLNYKKKNYLSYNECEHPLAIQLGGNDPHKLAICAKIAADKGYDEINLNLGCPSRKVKNGNFGASLMLDKALVVNCINTIDKFVSLPITLKIRTGVDNFDSYNFLHTFVKFITSNSNCKTIIIHARKALLNGLSNKNNRIIPKLNYNMVYDIKKDFPKTNIVINGGIKSINDSILHLKYTDGVMIGNEVYKNPNILNQVDDKIFNKPTKKLNRIDILKNMIFYIEKEIISGTDIKYIIKHMYGLFYGLKGSKSWKCFLNKYNKKLQKTEHKNFLKEISIFY